MNETDFVQGIINSTAGDLFCGYSFLAFLSDKNGEMFRFYLKKAERENFEISEFMTLPIYDSDRQRYILKLALDFLNLTGLKLDIAKIIDGLSLVNFGGRKQIKN